MIHLHQVVKGISLSSCRTFLAHKGGVTSFCSSPRTEPYGVPEGAPAICQENARNEEAVKSMAGSTVEYDCTLS